MKHRCLSVRYSRVAAFIVCLLLLTHATWAAPKYSVLHAFGKGTDGAGLSGTPTLASSGSLYGATSGGGQYGYGTVFKLAPHSMGSWGETILHSFKNNYDPSGSEPNGGLAVDDAGNSYGTTYYGGAYDVGAIFELTHGPSGWAESVLYSFGTQPNDGGFTTAGLIMDHLGNLYGTAEGGVYNSGVVFELSRGADGWNETELHEFDGSKGDGAAPYAGVIFDPAGSLYGTTYAGGGYQCGSDTCGTVYELKRAGSGWKEAILHRFRNTRQDGSWPDASLLRDAQGNLYGTTVEGGTYGGVVFELTPQAKGGWKETILYDFQGGADGWLPSAGVVMDKSGNLYGTTDGGGADGCGVIYKLAPAPKGQWTYTVLKTFYGADGCSPVGNLIMDKKGNLYGGTVLGGAYGGGVVFELTP
jgi:uncharacterized repeat protein (TIGR03803 family)